MVQIKLKLYANKHYEVIDNFCKDFQKMQNEDILKFLLDNENGLFNKMKVVCANTQRTLRMVMNKYICDVWKNGSKHLYFYTLHNQEHAIVLIQNIVKLINTIDFLKISSIDYYILFLACYLHDISMVKIPACDSFLLDTDKADELAKTLLDSYNEEFNKANLTKNVQGNDIDILSVKKYMLDSYRKIDNYFEEAVRSKHANDSAAEIRKRSELNYLDTSMRELVAEVSEAHGADERDIYGL